MKKKLLAISAAILLSAGAFAQLSGWASKMPITVSNTSTNTITNYQLKINVNTQTLIGASQMQASGNDIRFGKTCNGSTLYNYWIEAGINTPTTAIWVKIDTIYANSSRTFFMFYGNTSATAVSSIPSVFIGGLSATDSISGGSSGGVANSQRGFRFSPNEDILVTDFGKNEPNGTTRYVTLFDYTSQAIVHQDQVSGPAAQYSYKSLANPIWLTNGTQYLLEIFQGSSDGYYVTTSSQIDPHLTYYDMRFCNGCTQNTFPTNVLANKHYGYVDFMFYTKTNVTPAPTYTLNQGPLMSASQSASSICAGASLTLTASSSLSGMSYTWQPSGTVATTWVANPTTSTIYTVSGSASGCSIGVITKTLSITVSPGPTLTVSGNTHICGSGTRTVTASGASTYAWNTGDHTASIVVSPTVNTTYTVSGTNASGCSNTLTVGVGVSALPTVSVSGVAAVCSGSSASLTALGANTYTWNSGQTTASIVVSPTTTTAYTVTGTDANGCTNGYTRSLTVNSLPVVNATSSNTQLCVGSSATLTATGANTYTWNSGQTTASIVVSPTTTTAYTVTGTDANGCTNAYTRSLTVNSLPVVNATSSSTQLCVGSSATLTATGASTYTWNSGQTTASIVVSPTATTAYTVTGTDANGCTNAYTRTMTVNSLPVVNATSSSTQLCVGSSATLTATGALTYNWNSGQTTASIVVSPTTTTAYTVMGTDANGCTNAYTRTMTVNSLPLVNATSSSAQLCVGSSATLTATGALTYTWNSGQTTASIVVSPTTTTAYTVTGTDANGCTNAYTRSLTVNSLPVVNATSSSTQLCVGSSATLTATGASTYTWNSGQTTASIVVSPTTTTVYTVTGTDANGCTNAYTRSLTVNSLPVVNATSSSTQLCVGSSATLTATGASSYTWNSGQTTASIVVSPTATTAYTVTGTDANGCQKSYTVQQQVNSCTGVAEYSNTHVEFNIYPNPNTGIFSVEVSTEADIEVVDVLGNTIMKSHVVAGKNDMDMSHALNGVYLVKLQSEGMIKTIRVIKQ